MLKFIIMRILILILFSTWGISLQAQFMDSLSYSIGVLVGQNLRQQGFNKIDAATLAEAISNVITDQALKVDAENANRIVQDYLQAQSARKYETTIAMGTAFLEANKNRPGVVTLQSGLQYEVMTAGTGAKPSANDKVTVHYHGTLIDGTIFDSSVDRGQPATFGVTQVIQGWVEALQLMPLGSKWKLFIPYNLAYGERAAGAKISPYSTLIFEVELLKIN
jgi:FKBP-type peptidyl-prolyl cis-trans isomerase FklB